MTATRHFFSIVLGRGCVTCKRLISDWQRRWRREESKLTQTTQTQTERKYHYNNLPLLESLAEIAGISPRQLQENCIRLCRQVGLEWPDVRKGRRVKRKYKRVKK